MDINRHYLKSVTDLGDVRRIYASRDILTQNGTKLLARGLKIDSAIYERLVRQKLMHDLDSCIEAENPLTAEDLVREARELLAKSPLLSAIERNLAHPDAIWKAIASIPLRPEIAFKLMVAKEKRQKIYLHSLRVLLLSLYMGSRIALADNELVELAAAAMFHDLGELHIDPAIFSLDRPLNEGEWRQIYAHPVTAHLFLNEFPEYRANIGRAVIEHHERLDGSGYPQRLKGKEISLAGKIIAIAEVAEGLFDENRIEIVLKLNKQKLDTDLIGQITLLIPDANGAQAEKTKLAAIDSQLAKLARHLSRWDEIFAQGTANAANRSPLLDFVNERVGSLRQSLYDAGFNPLEMNYLVLGIENDPVAIRELVTLLGESRWQIDALAKETARLWPDFAASPRSDCIAVKNWLSEGSSLFGRTS